MAKHTKGPWAVEGPVGPEVIRGHIHIVDCPGLTVTSITPKSPHPVMDEQERQANARLIAASPELLEALKAIYINTFDKGSMTATLVRIMHIAEAAIAKAEGDVMTRGE